VSPIHPSHSGEPKRPSGSLVTISGKQASNSKLKVPCPYPLILGGFQVFDVEFFVFMWEQLSVFGFDVMP